MPASLAALAAVFAGLAVAVVVLGSILAERREVQRSLHAVATLSSGGGGAVMETPSFRQRVAIPALDRFTSLGRRLTPTAAADKLVKRLSTHELADDVRIVPHEDGVTVDNVNDRNAAHVEVLMAVLERREAATVVPTA